MSTPASLGRPSRYRRVVLDLAPRGADRRVLQAAAELARLLDAELHAVFVEDAALAALVDNPFARELRLPTHEWQSVTGAAMAEDVRLAVAGAQREVEAVRAALGLRGDTETRRGDPASLVASLCLQTDIVVLAPPALAAERALGPHARRSLALYRCAASVMLVPQMRSVRHGPVTVVAAKADDPALELAARIAARAGEELLVLAPAVVLEELARRSPEMHGRALAGQGGVDIHKALRGVSARLLVMMRGTVLPDADATLLALADENAVPVLALEPWA